MKKIIMIAAAFSFASIAARADWFTGDDHKMHFPQMPDLNGWDVDVTSTWIYDDWQCSETGPVSDVHLWASWKEDNIVAITDLEVEIWSDVPLGSDPNRTYSHPGNRIWSSGILDSSHFQVIDWPESGDQGWYAPTTGQWARPDHQSIQQVNITIPDPFLQEEGTTYWLGVHLIPANGEPQPMVGWKTSQDHFQDDAIYYDEELQNPDTGLLGDWAELFDPQTGESLDMAFVITPEPQSSALAALGFGLLCLRRKRNAAR